jgi:hypothetical protein
LHRDPLLQQCGADKLPALNSLVHNQEIQHSTNRHLFGSVQCGQQRSVLYVLRTMLVAQ